MDIDVTKHIKIKSDQLNADDFLGGPQTFTITHLSENPDGDQSLNIHTAETPDRVYRPNTTMKKVLVAIWGGSGNAYIGRRITLYRNPDVPWGKEKVGGIEIAAMSHIEKATTVSVSTGRSKPRRRITVQPIPDLAPAVTVQDVEHCTDLDMLRSWWATASEDVKTAITARANTLADLQAAAETETVQGELIDEVQS